MKEKFCLIFMMIILLTGCATEGSPDSTVATASNTITLPTGTRTATPTLQPSETPTPTPTETLTPTVTQTPSPTPIAGGGKIVFWGGNEAGEIKLYLTDSSGVERKTIVLDPKVYEFGSNRMTTYDRDYMEWSPDGNYLKFYLVDFENAKYYLFLYDFLNDYVVLLADQKLVIESYWSEDGSYIFYNLDGKLQVVDVRNDLETTQITYPENAAIPIGLMKDDQIFILSTHLDTSNTATFFSGGTISYLDESQELLSADAEPFDGLYTIDLSGQVHLIHEFDEELQAAFLGLWGSFHFVNDDVFFQSCLKNAGNVEACSLYSYDIASNQLDQILSFDNALAWDLSISPDGKKLWVGTGPLPGKTGMGEVKILDFETLEPIMDLVEPVQVRYGDPTWSPDSNYVIFAQTTIVNSSAQGSTLGRLDLLTGEVVTIVDDFAFISLPAWGE